jgi:subtilisin family serine protease
MVSCSKSPTDPTSPEAKTSTYIVTLTNDGNSIQGANINSRIQQVFAKHNIDLSTLRYSYSSLFQGFAADLTIEQVNSLQNDKSIEFVEKDQTVTLGNNLISIDSKKHAKLQAESIPWGIAYVGGYKEANTDTGIAWILDTGIDLNHNELNVNTSLSKSFVSTEVTPDDLHGHGTHVSGTIAAKAGNGIGVVGVCPGATLVAVKVLNSAGSGTYAGIIAGLDYVGINKVVGKLNVVNMSLGGGASTTLDNAVKSLASKGVKIVIAAGNDGRPAKNYSPARVEATGVYTISAHDNNGKFAYFSNYGNPPIEFAAPGVSIYSTFKDGLYATMTGTSMATPHVVGILLANNGIINTFENVTGDKDRTADKKAHL